MRSSELFVSRTKRQVTDSLVGDLADFRENGAKYSQFLNSLKQALTVDSQKYGGIRVTKADDGITKVIIKDGTTQIPFIFRNRDLYIIGVVLESSSGREVFYVDSDVSGEQSNRLPAAWKTVIGDASMVSLSVPLSYKNILQSSKVPINQMGKSLTQLTQLGDSAKRFSIIKQHLVPFVLAFSEALRFPVVAREVEAQFKKDGGELDTKKNILLPSGVGHPDQRKTTHYDIEWLLLNWGKLSDCTKKQYVDNSDCNFFKLRGEQLNLEKNQLNALLGVAASNSFPAAGRGKRSILIGQLQSQDWSNSFPTSKQIESQSSEEQDIGFATQNWNTAGAIQLLTVLFLYFTDQKLLDEERCVKSDLWASHLLAMQVAQKIDCFMDTLHQSPRSTTAQYDAGFPRLLSNSIFECKDITLLVQQYLVKRIGVIPDDIQRLQFTKRIKKLANYLFDSNPNAEDGARPTAAKCFMKSDDSLQWDQQAGLDSSGDDSQY